MYYINLFYNCRNFGVTVLILDHNIGASGARNRGMDEASADYVLFMDDDVEPSSTILDAYIGAIMRHPSARVLVGTTAMPAPVGLWTHAVTATQLSYFYDVADKMERPPWGVTANLCVRRYLPGGRMHRFKAIFPKAGGGGKAIPYTVVYSSIP